jgi:hypothetical protein
MHNIELMNGGKARGNLNKNIYGLIYWKRLAIDVVAQDASFDKLHSKEKSALVIPHIKRAHHIGMRDAARKLDFAEESLNKLVMPDQLGVEDLNRYLLSVEHGVGAKVHFTHPATSQQSFKPVALGKGNSRFEMFLE